MNTEALMHHIILDCARTFLRVDTYAEKVYVMKAQGVISDDPDEAVDCKEFTDRYLAANNVYKTDEWQFELLKKPQALVEYYRNSHDGTTLIYRRMEGQRAVWHRLDILIPSDHSPERPDILIYGHDLDSEESSFFAAYATYGIRLHKITKVNFQTGKLFVIQEPNGEKIAAERLDVSNYENAVQHASRLFIHPEDAPEFLEHFSRKAIQDYFAAGNSSFYYFCRRKIGGIYRWVKYLVVPSTDLIGAEEVYYFYVEDVHREMLFLLDFRAYQEYAKFFRKNYKRSIDAYYHNVLEVLHTMTQSYVDFYLVDLEKDLYMRYKTKSGTVKEAIPVIDSYSESSIRYIEEHCTGLQAEMLSLYCTSDKLREAMRDRLSLEYEFYSDDGVKLRTVCRKYESVNGVPTKALCYTVVAEDEHKLKIRTFGNFEALSRDDTPIRFTRKQSKQLLAYLVDRQGYLVSYPDIVRDILEKPEDDTNAIKYCSTLIRRAMTDLENAGYPNVIIKETRGVRVRTDAVDCDFYHLMNGDITYLLLYHNEYMKEYSWAESTNAEILSMCDL